jgi:RNA recognition motif-containing protein
MFEIFEPYGKVASTQVMTRDGRSRGFGFVIFSELPRADLLASSGNLTVRGRPISVKPSIPQEEMQELPPPEKRTKKLFIGGLPHNMTVEDLEHTFQPYGRLVDAEIIADKGTGESRGFGFVTFSTEEAADNAIRSFPGEIAGRAVSVKRAEPKASEGGPAAFTDRFTDFTDSFLPMTIPYMGFSEGDAMLWKEKYLHERSLRISLEKRLAALERGERGRGSDSRGRYRPY